MRRLVPGVYLLEGLFAGCVYALAVDGGVVLIDSGLPGSAPRIRAGLVSAGFAAGDLRAVVLTHAHPDHTGSAAQLAAETGAEVLAHREEIPYAEGVQPLPYRSWIQRAVLGGKGRAAPHARRLKVSRALDDGEVLEALGGLQVLHTPGHTPGSICLYWPAGRVLFSGDLLVYSRRFTTFPALRFSIPQFSVDRELAQASARRLLALPVDVLCCGHGGAITEGVPAKIGELLDGMLG